MKKMLIIASSLFVVILLSSCGILRERLLAPPDEVEIPEGSLVAICEKDDVTYKHIYQNDGIYQYYINDVLQDENVMDSIQEQAYLHGESMANYLIDEYGVDGCEIQDYVTPIFN